MTDHGAVATLRPMRWVDIEAVHDIEERVFPRTAWTPEMFWAELAGVPATRWYCVATYEGSVVGFAGLMSASADADVQTIAVDVSMQSQGLGQQLLDGLIQEARRRGCTRVFLEVAADNVRAQSLYGRNGFEVSARRSNYYAGGGDALVMVRTSIDAGQS